MLKYKVVSSSSSRENLVEQVESWEVQFQIRAVSTSSKST